MRPDPSPPSIPFPVEAFFAASGIRSRSGRRVAWASRSVSSPSAPARRRRVRPTRDPYLAVSNADPPPLAASPESPAAKRDHGVDPASGRDETAWRNLTTTQGTLGSSSFSGIGGVLSATGQIEDDGGGNGVRAARPCVRGPIMHIRSGYPGVRGASVTLTCKRRPMAPRAASIRSSRERCRRSSTRSTCGRCQPSRRANSALPMPCSRMP